MSYTGSYGDGTGSYGDGRGYFSYGSASSVDDDAVRLRAEYEQWDRERGSRRLTLASQAATLQP